MFRFGMGAPLQASTRLPLEDRGPLRTLFLLSNMPVGGAEVLLSNLMDRFDPDRIQPEFACLKDLGELGEDMAVRFKATSRLIKGKYDVAVVRRLAALMVRHRIDAVVTVGAGDKMFWGRIAAKVANVPVILSALHSTGWPDGVGKLNRMLTSWTDGFIAVASEHGRFLREFEKFPADKVFVIPNGVDTQRFVRNEQAGQRIRNELKISADAPVIGIVAALRPEKNHSLFLEAAQRIAQVRSDAHFVIVGDGPCRSELEKRSAELGLTSRVHFLGTRSDTPEILSAMDVFCLTSHNEANPVSILEALSTEVPVVATDVGSVSLTVQPGKTGFLAEPGSREAVSGYVLTLLEDAQLSRTLGEGGRLEVAHHWSLDAMVQGYENLISNIYAKKCKAPLRPGFTVTHVQAKRPVE